jgi:hypothetical protein
MRGREQTLSALEHQARAETRAMLICSAAMSEAENAMRVVELPLGEAAGRVLDQIERARAFFSEIESNYKKVLESTPGAVPVRGESSHKGKRII